MEGVRTKRIRVKTLDYKLLLIIVVLVILGIIFLSSASSVISYENYDNSEYMLLKQIFSIILGFAGMAFFYRVDTRVWKKYSFLLMIISMIGIMAVFLPGVGVNSNGANRWLDLGPIRLQPSEILKFSLIIYFASLFEKKGLAVKSLYQGTLPFVAIMALISFLIISQPDLGSLLIILAIAGVMYFVSGAKMSHLATLAFLGVSTVILFIRTSPYRMERFTVFLDPQKYSNDEGHQVVQALIAIGSGGIFGIGFHNSIQKYKYLPEPSTDSIFAIIGEERGMIGALFVILLFSAFGFLGYKIAKRTNDPYNRLLAIGITTWVVMQAFLNIAATLSLVPLTGITLPFISYGGTSVSIMIAACGLLLNISKNAASTEGGK